MDYTREELHTIYAALMEIAKALAILDYTCKELAAMDFDPFAITIVSKALKEGLYALEGFNSAYAAELRRHYQKERK